MNIAIMFNTRVVNNKYAAALMLGHASTRLTLKDLYQSMLTFTILSKQSYLVGLQYLAARGASFVAR